MPLMTTTHPDSLSGIAEINDTGLYYEVTGDGPPVVLLHGFSLDTRMWDEQVAPLAESYRVIRCDLRGFGRSAIPEPGVLYRHADDVQALLAHLNAREVVLVGLSLGGAVALDVARAHPGVARALVLVDSVLPGFETPGMDADIRAVWGAGRREGAEAARSLWLDVPFFTCLRERPDAWARFEPIVRDYSGWGWTSPDPGRWVEPPCASDLGRVSVPALVVVGERDVPDIQRIGDALVEGLPLARKVTLPGLGHIPNMEDPAAFNAVLLQFLDEQSP
jgi:pimeloyl-ACP methyl ester carboxylesterase